LKLRKHQREFKEIVDGIIGGSPVRKIIVSATPGSGKSLIPILAGKLITAGKADKLAWVCPRSSLQNQGEHNFIDPRFRSLLSHELTIRASTNDEDPCRGLHGFITTAQAVGMDKKQTVLRDFKRYRYVLIIDEGHHSADGGEGDEGAWMKAMAPLCESAAFIIIMSGTMSRHDGKRIAFIPYRQIALNEFIPDFDDREDIAYIEYSRSDALTEKAIIPLNFMLHDGQAEWVRDGKEKTSRLSTVNIGNSKGALFTALRTEYALELLSTGILHWTEWRRTHQTSRFLVVAANIKVTHEYTDYLKGLSLSCAIATSDDDKGSAKAIKAYKAGKIDVLVTCQVAYEGLDCPSISHVASLTNIRSQEWIEQMCGRVVRIDPHAGPYRSQMGFVFAPDDFLMKQIILKIQASQIACAHAKGNKGTQEKEETPIGGVDKGEENPYGIIPIGSRLTDQREYGMGNGYDVAPSGYDYAQEPPKTQSEIEEELRGKIEKHLRKFAFDNYYKPQRINKEVRDAFEGKARADMTVPELRKVLSYIRNVYPLGKAEPDPAKKRRGSGRRVPTKAVPWNHQLSMF